MIDKLVTVFGTRQTKRDPIIASSPIKELKIAVGDTIDDGTNLEITLASNLPESVANQMLENLESRFTKRQWKFSVR
jgi:hypothetical protein